MFYFKYLTTVFLFFSPSFLSGTPVACILGYITVFLSALPFLFSIFFFFSYLYSWESNSCSLCSSLSTTCFRWFSFMQFCSLGYLVMFDYIINIVFAKLFVNVIFIQRVFMFAFTKCLRDTNYPRSTLKISRIDRIQRAAIPIRTCLFAVYPCSKGSLRGSSPKLQRSTSLLPAPCWWFLACSTASLLKVVHSFPATLQHLLQSADALEGTEPKICDIFDLTCLLILGPVFFLVFSYLPHDNAFIKSSFSFFLVFLVFPSGMIDLKVLSMQCFYCVLKCSETWVSITHHNLIKKFGIYHWKTASLTFVEFAVWFNYWTYIVESYEILQGVKCHRKINEHKGLEKNDHCFKNDCSVNFIIILGYRRTFIDINGCPEIISALTKVTDLGSN